jgi:hypothetical protein
VGILAFGVAKTGSGKSTSLRNLDENETVIINSDQKALPFRRFEERYNEKKGNYLQSSNTADILSKLKEANKNSKIKTVVIDTWSRIMTDAVMSKDFRATKGFDKYMKMAGGQYDLLNIINEKMRKDIIVYLFAHPEEHQDEDGYTTFRIGVQGKMLERFVPESFSSIVLYGDVIKNPGKPNEHVFRTISGGNDTCKTPMDMFEEETIPNDLVLVNEKIRDYYGI